MVSGPVRNWITMKTHPGAAGRTRACVGTDDVKNKKKKFGYASNSRISNFHRCPRIFFIRTHRITRRSLNRFTGNSRYGTRISDFGNTREARPNKNSSVFQFVIMIEISARVRVWCLYENNNNNTLCSYPERQHWLARNSCKTNI